MPRILSDITSAVLGVSCLVVASRYSGFIGYGLLQIYFAGNIVWVCDDVSVMVYDAVKWLGCVVFEDFLVDFLRAFVV